MLSTRVDDLAFSLSDARTFGRETESAKPFLNLLDILTVDNIYRLEILKFSHSWHNSLLPEVQI